MNPNNLIATKNTDTSYAGIGDIINYTIELTNSGTVPNVNIILTDLVPQGANYINNTVLINNSNAGNVNPALGVSLPNMAVSDIVTITFQAQVVNVPTDNPMQNVGQIDYQYTNGVTLVAASIDTNTVDTYVNAPVIQIRKQAPSIASVGSSLTFSITVENIGTATARNLTFLDTIPLGTTFVPNSMILNGSPVAGSPEPPTGYNSGDLPNGYYNLINFDVDVVSIPPNGVITNVFDATYDYNIDPVTIRDGTGRASSNQTTSSFQIANLSGITKSVDKAFASCGDTLTYTITIPNSGQLTATNVVVSDTLASSLLFISNSVVVNGVTVPNPPSNISVGTIVPGGIATVTFKAIVSC